MRRNCLNYTFVLLLSLALSAGCSKKPLQGITAKEFHRKNKNKEIVLSTRESEEKLDRLSNVKENTVFTEKKGYPEYKIGPSDMLEITSRIGSEYKIENVLVRSDGTISYSFVDNLEVEGLTAREIDKKLTKRLSNYVRNPRIDLLVKEFNSKNALVMGEVGVLRYVHYEAGSGKIPLKGKTTLLDLLVTAGGYTDDANIKNIKLIRDDEIYYINLYDIVYKGKTAFNVIIDDGDMVEVPELPEYGEKIYVLGEVNYQGIYSLENAPDLLAALSLAGSYTRTAVEENTVVIRGYEPGKEPFVITSDVNTLLKKGDIEQNISLKDGDIVYVPRSTIGDVNEFIINTVPLLDYLLYPGKFRDAYGSHKHLRLD